jgi:hypothetical protein
VHDVRVLRRVDVDRDAGSMRAHLVPEAADVRDAVALRRCRLVVRVLLVDLRLGVVELRLEVRVDALRRLVPDLEVVAEELARRDRGLPRVEVLVRPAEALHLGHDLRQRRLRSERGRFGGGWRRFALDRRREEIGDRSVAGGALQRSDEGVAGVRLGRRARRGRACRIRGRGRLRLAASARMSLHGPIVAPPGSGSQEH